MLHVLSFAGTAETWLTELNAVIRESKQPAARVSQGSIPRAPVASLPRNTVISRRVGTSDFSPPTLETLPFGSIPPQVLGQLAAIGDGERQDRAFSVEDLLPRLEQIESPVVRAWLAVKSGNRDAIDATLAVVPPPDGAVDFELLRAFDFLRSGRAADALAPLVRAGAAAGSNHELVAAINRILIAAAGLMTPQERQDHYAEIERHSCNAAGSTARGKSTDSSRKRGNFGFEELEKRIAAVGQSASPAAGRSGRVTSLPAGVPTSIGRNYRLRHSQVRHARSDPEIRGGQKV